MKTRRSIPPFICAEMPVKRFGGYQSPRFAVRRDSGAVQRLCNARLRGVQPTQNATGPAPASKFYQKHKARTPGKTAPAARGCQMPTGTVGATSVAPTGKGGRP